MMKTCVIRAASHMSGETYDYICAQAKKRFGDDLSFRRITDDSVLGGFVLEIGTEVYDLSYATQLAEINKQIRG